MSPEDSRTDDLGHGDEVRVCLSDGRTWALPLRASAGSDPEYDALLAAVCEAADRAEGLRAELALTIFLLDRTYKLPADRLGSLLSFEPESPALDALQRSVHDLALRSLERRRAARRSGSERPAGRRWSSRSGLLRRFLS